MNMLIVDDYEENRYLLETMLKGSGHDVQTAANGAEALEKLRAGGVELIISDILMPVMDGFQLCRKVKTDETLCHIPFIIYTATYTGPQDEAFAMKIGADRFIQKPCEPDVFMRAVGDVMAAAGRSVSASTPEPMHEVEILKLYSERLVRKLEKKMLELEREIQVRGEIEETLRESERKYRLLADNTLDIIWAIDLNLAFTYVNPAIQSLMGYSPEEFIGSHLSEHCDEENFGRMTQVIADEMAKGPEAKGVIFETEIFKKNGESIPVEIHGKVIYSQNGHPVMLQGVVRDISERIQTQKENQNLQAQLQQAQKMEAVGRLAGGVAHDYNNILSVIMGYTELSLDEVEPDGPLHENLNEILGAARRTKEVTRQLLAFARQQTIAPKVIDLNEAIESMLKMLRRLIGEDIDLAWLPESGLWPVKMDPVQLDQLLANLCVNARDAISGVGKVTIETDRVTLDNAYCAQHAGFIPGEFDLLAVSDDGHGMDKETCGKIFEPFFTTKQLGKGTGMGLATVYGIVMQNNGFINVYSEPGKGTTFRVYLPRHAGKTEKLIAQETKQVPRSRGESVLIVEDERSILKMAKQMLEKLGYQVLTADSPSMAIRLAEEHAGQIHLLIVDVVMPEMNGRELAHKLIALYPDMQVLFMSGYTANVIAHRGVLDEGVNFIQKPLSMDELAFKSRAVLDNGQA